MRMRTTMSIAALLLAALLAAPAQGKLVYVKQADTASPVVYVANDKGKQPRRLGIGRAPAISPVWRGTPRYAATASTVVRPGVSTGVSGFSTSPDSDVGASAISARSTLAA